MEQLIELVQEKVPEFTTRRMTFEDFLGACTRQRLDVEIRPFHRDEQLRREQNRIVINAGLSEPYRIFVGFHALAHWFGHPGRNDFYLGSPGWLDTIELEASAIGFLALAPLRRPGPPYPRLVRASHSTEQMEFYVEYPEDFHVDAREGTIKKGRWRPLTTKLARLAQMDLALEGPQPSLPFPRSVAFLGRSRRRR